jgi:cysteine desulfurase / selenocysteine lyase
MIYLDNAATSWPKPEIVYQTVDKFMREKGGNPGHGSHSLAEAAKRTIEDTRTLVARFINATERDRVVFTLNCTQSINIGLKGLLKRGDHVITSSLEHNAVMRPLWKLEQNGIKITQIPISPTTGITSAADIEAEITPQTRMIAMIHASNVNGVIQPVGEYGKIARQHNLAFLVDAAQSAGHMSIDVQADNIDLLAFSGHKGTLGPPGVGVLYISPRVNPETLFEGGTGPVSESESQPDSLPEKYESGTMNGPSICGLGAGLQYILDEGLARINSHELDLTKELIEGLAKISGITLYNARDEIRQSPVISFNIKGYQSNEVGAILDKSYDIKVRAGLHCAPEAHRSIGTLPPELKRIKATEDFVDTLVWMDSMQKCGTVRLSPGYFNTRAEIEQTLQAVKQIAESRSK